MFLGIDLGTTGVKAVIIDESQAVIATAQSPLTVARSQALWSEQDPNDWWQATQHAILQLKACYPDAFAQLQAIGLSGQMHGATLLDKQDKVLRPAILWNDGRSGEQAQALMQRLPAIKTITGNLVMPGFTAPKLVWVKQHEPETFAAVNTVLLPKDYIRFCLSGDKATDVSDASGTSWLNVAKRQWSDECLHACDLSRAHMPEVFEGNAITGYLKPEFTKAWGLQANVAIVAGGGDNAASAISMNIIAPGQAFLSLGTSGVYFVVADRFHAHPDAALHSFCHCLPDRWHVMSVHLSAAACLGWLAELLNVDDLNALIDRAQAAKQRHGLLFLPYLSGERTPLNDPFARGTFLGLDYDTRQETLVQAVLEGVAFAFAEGQVVIEQAGVNINEVSVVGGGARNLYWGEILASVLQRQLCFRQNRAMGAAFGAARLAWLALHPAVELSTALSTPKLEQTVTPHQDWCAYYQQQRQLFSKTYQCLKPLFKARLNT